MNKSYVLPALALLLIEIFIALFVRDQFFRPYFGDYLAVILLYLILRIFNISIKIAAISSLIFACSLEFFQWTGIWEHLRLYRFEATHMLIGRRFHFLDLIFYFLAYFSIIITENYRQKSKNNIVN